MNSSIYKEYIRILSVSVGSPLEYIRYLGSGTYGEVIAVRAVEYGTNLAVKIVKKYDCVKKHPKALEREYRLGIEMGNIGIGPFIVAQDCITMPGGFFEEQKSYPCILMEMFDVNVGTIISSMAESQRRIKDQDVINYMIIECNKLIDKMLLRSKYYFYDVKPGNFVYKIRRMCMIDFDDGFMVHSNKIHKKYLGIILKLQMFFILLINSSNSTYLGNLGRLYNKQIQFFLRYPRVVFEYLSKYRGIEETFKHYCSIVHKEIFKNQESVSLPKMMLNLIRYSYSYQKKRDRRMRFSRQKSKVKESPGPVRYSKKSEILSYARKIRSLLH
jgi:hypothetical protein